VNRTQKLKLNTITSLLSRVTILLSGLILPRLILNYYGSEVNGLVQSITQFLTIITFLDLGVGSVVQSALFRPLTTKDNNQISRVLTAAKNYFRRIAYFLIVYVVILVFTYPFITSNQGLDYLGTALLIVAISIRTFSQYYFGIVNELLLNADQRGYIQFGSETIVVFLNLLASVFLITQGFSIQLVKFVASLIFLIRPLYLMYYVNKNYRIEKDMELTEDPLPQKWNGVGQHLAYSIQNSTDVTILTLFSTLSSVSVYSVYNMVVQAIRLVIQSFTSGLMSFFGNLLASGERERLNNYFTKIEWLMHTLVIYLYGLTATLIVPFVMLYTSGVTDADYYAPLFGVFLVLARVANSIRTPYQAMIFAAGHYRQTQLSSFIEAGSNIFLSVILVVNFGLVGVAIGTFISMIYRTVYLTLYLSKNILYRPIKLFIKHIVVDVISFSLMFITGLAMVNIIEVNTLIDWLIVACILGVLFIIMLLIINLLVYKDTTIYFLNYLKKRIK